MTWFAWAVLAAFLWGVGPVFAKMGLVKSDPFTALFVRSLGVITALAAVGLATAKLAALKDVEPRTWLLLVGEGLAAALLGHFAYFQALKIGQVANVTPVVASYPLVATALAVLLLGEKITLGRSFGAALIVLGIWLIRRF